MVTAIQLIVDRATTAQFGVRTVAPNVASIARKLGYSRCHLWNVLTTRVPMSAELRAALCEALSIAPATLTKALMESKALLESGVRDPSFRPRKKTAKKPGRKSRIDNSPLLG